MMSYNPIKDMNKFIQTIVIPSKSAIDSLLDSISRFYLTISKLLPFIIFQMSGLGLADSFRKYYVDHPTSINHQQNYLIPLQNQYSILNKSRNPYAALDHFSTDISQKVQQKNTSYIRALEKESLDLQLKSWEKRQQDRERDLRMARSEVRELQGIARLKEMEHELNALSRTNRKSPQATVIPFPMFMPMFNQAQNTCCCQCSCRCQHSCAPPTQTKRYKPVITENCAVETDPEPITNAPKLSSVRSVKTVKPPTVQNLPSAKTVVAPVPRMPLAKRKALLRKFRVVSIAIYFAIYFKWFSFQFSVNRYNNFRNKYLMDNGKAITENYKQVYTELLKIDIPKLIRAAAQKVPSGKPTQNFDIGTLLKNEAAAKFKKMGQLTVLSKDSEALFMRCGQFLLSLLGAVEDTLADWDWGDVGYGLGVGCLNQSFVIDNVFLPHEIYLMVFHDGKGYARVIPQAQKILTMTKFIIKLLLFNICLQLDNNKEWFQMYQEELKDREDLDELFILLQISSKILFIICQNIYETSLEDHDPNYDQVESKFQIQPCNSLVYSHSIKRRRELFKDQALKDSNLLIYGIERLDEVNNFMIQPFFKQMQKRITAKLNHAINSVHNKLSEFNRQKYNQIWEETLANQYVILRGLKKIMRPNKYYPYASASVLASKSNLPTSNKTLTKKTIERDSQKLSSINSKISLENILSRNRR